MKAEADVRPLITFALISYRDERYIREAVEGAFGQTYQPLEVILSNDCSPDNTFGIMRAMAAEYRGPHRIVLNRNAENLGTAGHINRIMELSRGELIVIAAGDDVSLPDRTLHLYKAYRASNGRAKSLNSASVVIDEEGRTRYVFREHQPEERYRLERMDSFRYILTGCTHAWSREVFDTFGPLQTPLSCEDMVIPFRSALLGEIVYVDEPLVKYRQHNGNLWPKDVLALEKFFAVQSVAICRNWLRDLDTFLRMRPGDQGRIAAIQARTREQLAQAEEKAYLYTCSWLRRAAYLFTTPVTRPAFKTRIRYLVLFLAPPVYRICDTVRKQIRRLRKHLSCAQSTPAP